MKMGVWELLIVLAIALLIFGPKALPKLGKSFGKTIGSFKKGLNEDDEDETEKKPPVPVAESTSGTDKEA